MKIIHLSLFSLLIVVLMTLGLYSSMAANRQYRVLYVSTSEGNNNNQGNIPERPLYSIAAALGKADTIKLKAGDVFYEHPRVERAVITRYGEGENPTLCGYKRIIKPNWKKVGENLWCIDLTEDNYSGVNINGASLSNNIGFFHEYDKGEIHGYKHQYISELKEDWDFAQGEHFSREVDPSEFNFVYLYLKNSPNELKLEMPIYDDAIDLRNSKMIQVNVTGFSTGVSISMGGDVIGCKIDAVGGRTCLGLSHFGCAGNGIQYWVGDYDINDCVVEDCYVSRCYDCGITIQGTCGKGHCPHNVIVRNNLIVNCCQGWEDFLHHDDAYYDNCVFENNIVVFSGETEWGYPKKRFKRCHILQNNNNGLKGMIFRSNTFISGNYYCSSARGGDYSSAKWQSNICYIEEGRYLMGNYEGTMDVVRISRKDGSSAKFKKENTEAIAMYRCNTKDTTTVFVVVSDRMARRLGNKAIRKYLKTHIY